MIRCFAFRNKNKEMFLGFDRKGDAMWQCDHGMRLFIETDGKNVNRVVMRYPFLLDSKVVFFNLEEKEEMRLTLSALDAPEPGNEKKYVESNSHC